MRLNTEDDFLPGWRTITPACNGREPQKLARLSTGFGECRESWSSSILYTYVVVHTKSPFLASRLLSPSGVGRVLAARSAMVSVPAALLMLSLLALCGAKPALREPRSCHGKDLPAEAPLQITVMAKPDKCPRQTADGNKLSMCALLGPTLSADRA